MPRRRERVCLQDGLKLDLNRLARKGFVQLGGNIGLRGIRWSAFASGRNCLGYGQRGHEQP
jgi:hypothetical protein